MHATIPEKRTFWYETKLSFVTESVINLPPLLAGSQAAGCQLVEPAAKEHNEWPKLQLEELLILLLLLLPLPIHIHGDSQSVS